MGKNKCKTVAIFLPLVDQKSDFVQEDFLQRFVQLSLGDPIVHEIETDSNQQTTEENDDDDSTPFSFEFDDAYIVSLDASEWKEHDHYRILGLRYKRSDASAAEIKSAYRQLVLRHHPDKRKVPLEERQSDYFPAIVKSFEILSNPKKRIAYDSVDPEFDDSIPSRNKSISPEKFLDVFGPVFERNARWSAKTPVPLLGDDNTSYDELMNFYKFWLNFESWREYSYLDEEEKEKGADRDERRYLDKLNKAERQRRKNAEITRIRQLVDCAMLNDPRLKRRKEDELRRKQEEKEKKRVAAAEKHQEVMAQEEEKRKVEELKAAEAKELAEKEKRERDAAKKAAKTQRKRFKDLCKTFNNFCEEEIDIDLKSWWLEGIDLVCTNLEVEDLKTLNEELSKCNNDESQVKSIVEEQIKMQHSQLEEKKKELLNQQQKQSSQTPNGDHAKGADVWTTEEVQCLVKALQVLPPGTDKRWVAISNFINNHVHNGKQVRSSKQVVNKAKNLQNLNNEGNQEVKNQIKQKSVEAYATNHMTSQNGTPESIPTERTDDAVIWSPQEQKLLEAALKNYPPDTEKRWEKVSAAVPGKSKRECMQRYKEIVELLKAKKAAQSAKATAGK